MTYKTQNYDLRKFGIGGIILIGILGILFAGNYFLNNLPTNETPEITLTDITVTSTFELTTTATKSLAISTTTRYGIGSTTLGSDGMLLMYVPAGEFTMGSENGNEDEKPEHQVYLDAFWIDQTEVTNAMYAKCVEARECPPPNATTSATRKTRNSYYSNPEFDNFPVIYVSWYDAVNYCEFVDRRLPTEAEWEKAARGTDGNIYPWGNEDPKDNLLNSNSNVSDTTAVGSYSDGASPYGALDMAGNVMEWTSSLYQSYPYDANDGRESLTSTDWRMLRGGSWYYYVRSAQRDRYFAYNKYPTYADNTIGFRCAMDADQ